MAEYTANAVQSVATGNNTLFTDTAIPGSKCIYHRPGSGIVFLRGIGTSCRARYRISFNANIAAVTTAGAISAAISVDGEALGSATMISNAASIGEYSNVSASAIIDVPAGCCSAVSVQNTSTQAITVQNANLIVERVSA